MRRRGPVRRWLARIVRVLLGAFLGLNAYALALAGLPVPGSILMIQRTVEGKAVRRQPVPLSAISPHLVRAVIAAEDSRFCSHHGIDPQALRQALAEARAGKRLRGASTITQQTAKNALLWNGGGMARKGAEAWFAPLIDFAWGKRRVMEAYLNLAEWGDGLFGAEAAAQVRFGKPAADLTRREAALLAAVLPSPNHWRIDPPGPYVAQRTATLEARMHVVEANGLDACVLQKRGT